MAFPDRSSNEGQNMRSRGSWYAHLWNSPPFNQLYVRQKLTRKNVVYIVSVVHLVVVMFLPDWRKSSKVQSFRGDWRLFNARLWTLEGSWTDLSAVLKLSKSCGLERRWFYSARLDSIWQFRGSKRAETRDSGPDGATNSGTGLSL